MKEWMEWININETQHAINNQTKNAEADDMQGDFYCWLCFGRTSKARRREAQIVSGCCWTSAPRTDSFRWRVRQRHVIASSRKGQIKVLFIAETRSWFKAINNRKSGFNKNWANNNILMGNFEIPRSRVMHKIILRRTQPITKIWLLRCEPGTT